MNQNDVSARLSEQCRHQDQLDRKRMTWWIPWIFVIGLCFSALGLFTSVEWIREGGALRFTDVFVAFFFVFFSLCVGAWLMWPFRIRPRIVPYFAREVEKYGGQTSAAFARGRGLYKKLDALDQLAGVLGESPLSAFGFADDFYEQEVHWHAASEGLRTVEALRQGLSAQLLAAPNVFHDLEVLASALRVAADRGIDFSLVLRLYRQESIQVISTQLRQGRFW